MHTRHYLLIGFLGLLMGCVSAYDPNLTLNTRLVVVNGIITDLPEQQTIVLSQARSTNDSGNVSTPISNAVVQVVVNGAETLQLTETFPGTYVLPTGFAGKVGNSYQLRFKTAQGAQYESSIETMEAVPTIQKAYDSYNPRGPKTTADGLPIPANDIYIDFTDPGTTRNFYLWRWRLYEIQAWCATCKQGRYVVRDIGPVGSGPIEVIGCVSDYSLPYNNMYDYTCRGNCWDIFYSNTIDAFADVYTNGQTQVGHKVASIPIYQTDPALVVIEQLSLSANAYRYYKLFADQVQNTGTLADSPPAPISGNVTNLADVSEHIVGYFGVSSVAVNRYKLNRLNVPLARFKGLFYAQNGRLPNVEVPTGQTQYGQGLPSALCLPGRYRTDQIPLGWNQ